MEHIGKVIGSINLQASLQTKPQSQPSNGCNSEQTFITVWRGLQSGRYIPKSELVDGTEYKYWKHQLADMTDEQLLGGLKATKDCDVEAYKLTWSKFREICLQSKKAHASHQVFKALPHKRTDPEQARKNMDAVYLANPSICPERHRERLGL